MNLFKNPNLIVFCDAPELWSIFMQDPATPIVEGMIFFYNYIMVFVLVIGVFVCFLIGDILYQFTESTSYEKRFFESSILEVIWTVVPAIVLLFMAVPSFTLLYSLDELMDPSLSIKVIGHQWYWSYEYSDFQEENTFFPKKIVFDSYMLNLEDLNTGSFRLLEVDHRMMLPIKTHIRLLITSSDVLHSWAVPSFGMKVDACPGSLTQSSLFLKRAGIYYGQCSEICGMNHGFMPIVVVGKEPNVFFNNWYFLRLLFINYEDMSDLENLCLKFLPSNQ